MSFSNEQLVNTQLVKKSKKIKKNKLIRTYKHMKTTNIMPFSYNKYKNLLVTQLFAVLWSIWSFKLLYNLNILKINTDKDNIKIQYSKNIYLAHREKTDNYFNYVIKSGVCPLGTFGSIMIVVWASFMMMVMKHLERSRKFRNRLYISKGLSGATFFIMLIYLYLTYVMNFPLFLRTIPWFGAQAYISYQLYNYFKK